MLRDTPSSPGIHICRGSPVALGIMRQEVSEELGTSHDKGTSGLHWEDVGEVSPAWHKVKNVSSAIRQTGDQLSDHAVP